MIIAVDFDGTCVTHEFPRIGKDIGAIPVLKDLVSNGHQLILLTVRNRNQNDFGDTLQFAVDWFRKNEIELYGINRNPRYNVADFDHKVYAALYIDDAALGCPVMFNETMSRRPFVDWKRVREMLENSGIINSPKFTVTVSRKDNLCDHCKLSQPECNPERVEFGDGLGHDNVISCSAFSPNRITELLSKKDRELPTDEQIVEMANEIGEKEVWPIGRQTGFVKGARWIRDLMQERSKK